MRSDLAAADPSHSPLAASSSAAGLPADASEGGGSDGLPPAATDHGAAAASGGTSIACGRASPPTEAALGVEPLVAQRERENTTISSHEAL